MGAQMVVGGTEKFATEAQRAETPCDLFMAAGLRLDLDKFVSVTLCLGVFDFSVPQSLSVPQYTNHVCISLPENSTN